ncbi:MAG: hypothetical protein Q7J84_12540 [Sulfuricaulis sp.]|nr:hypothetical protein [Sulfuricaulis sp.]
MIAILVSVLVSAVSVSGWGALLFRLLGASDKPRVTNLAELGIAGLFLLTAIGTIAHFFIPISTWVTSLCLVTGIGLAFRYRHLLPIQKNAKLTLASFFLFSILFAFLAYIREYHADTEFYHLPTIVWLHTSNTPIGVSNLFDQLGFNSSWFVLASMFWLPALSLTSVFAVDALILTLVFTGLFQVYRQAWGNNHGHKASILYSFLGLGFCLTGGISFIKIIGSPNTDIPAAALTIYIFYLALKLSEEKLGTDEYDLGLSLMIVSGVFAVAIKLSQLPLLALPCFYLGRMYLNRFIPSKFIKRTMWLVGLFLIVWLVRGVFLSGCLLYPQHSTCIQELPWTVPLEKAVKQHDAIRAYGLYGTMGVNHGLGNWEWLPGWWQRFTAHHFVRGMTEFVTLAAVFLVAGYLLQRWASTRRKQPPHASAEEYAAVGSHKLFSGTATVLNLLFYSFLCILFWFLTSPDIRFAYGFLASACVLLTVLLVAGMSAGARKIYLLTIKVLIFASFLLNALNLVLVTKPSDLTAKWPAIAPLNPPPPGCPDYLGLWPMYKCEVGRAG